MQHLLLVVVTFLLATAPVLSYPRHRQSGELDEFPQDTVAKETRHRRSVDETSEESHAVTSTDRQSYDTFTVPASDRLTSSFHPQSGEQRSFSQSRHVKSNPRPSWTASVQLSGEHNRERGRRVHHDLLLPTVYQQDGVEHVTPNILYPPVTAAGQGHRGKQLPVSERVGEKAMCGWAVNEVKDDTRVPRVLTQAVLDERSTGRCRAIGGRCEAVTYNMTVSHQLRDGRVQLTRHTVTVAFVCAKHKAHDDVTRVNEGALCPWQRAMTDHGLERATPDLDLMQGTCAQQGGHCTPVSYNLPVFKYYVTNGNTRLTSHVTRDEPVAFVCAINKVNSINTHKV